MFDGLSEEEKADMEETQELEFIVEKDFHSAAVARAWFVDYVTRYVDPPEGTEFERVEVLH